MAHKRQRSKGAGTLFKKSECGPWRASWYDHNGKRRERSTRTTDRAAAERILAKLVADTALRRDGVIDVAADRYAAAARRPIGEHLDAFKRGLETRGNTADYVAERDTKARRVIELAGIERLSEMTPTTVQAAIDKLRHERTGENDPGPSLRTLNKYMEAVKAFSRWLRRERLTREHQLETLSRFNEDEDPRHERRDLGDDELARLIKMTTTRDIEGGMTGRDRAALYLLAASTGYRRNELKSLTLGSFDLDADPPAVSVAAEFTKAGAPRPPADPPGRGGVGPGMACGQAGRRTGVPEHAAEHGPYAALGPEGGAHQVRSGRQTLRFSRPAWRVYLAAGTHRGEREDAPDARQAH